MASQDLGPLGPTDGPAVQVDCPPGDSQRSVAGWFVLLLLLLLRKANRTRQAWAILLPLLMLHLILAVVERQLNAYLVFHYHQYICSAICDLLRYLSLGIAVLLAIADLLTVPWRWLRFVVVFVFLFLSGNMQIAANAWPFLNTGAWSFLFGQFLLFFMIGHSILNAILRRTVKRDRFGWWYGGLCLALGVIPLLILGAMEWRHSGSVQLQSNFEQYRFAVVLSSALSLPYFVFFWFILLSVRSPFYRDRLSRAFGVND